MSVAEINKPLIGGQYAEATLADPRLGTTDASLKCATCNGDEHVCGGHFGHIELAQPIYHVGFLSTVLKILRCVCHRCSKLLGDPRLIEILETFSNPRFRLREISKLCATRKKCLGTQEISDTSAENEDLTHAGCGEVQPHYKRDTLTITYTFPSSEEEGVGDSDILTAQRAVTILKNMSVQDIRLLGFDTEFARPEWFIVQVVPVPPPHVRPIVRMSSNQISHDDQTHKLNDLIKANKRVQDSLNQTAQVIKDAVELLQFHHSTWIDNNMPSVPLSTHSSGRPLKSIRQRLAGKFGRLRLNLMGKRVDFSARTVITPDPNLSLDEVGVPFSIARQLTYPERVTPHNYKKLKQCIANGPHVHPGAVAVIRNNSGDAYELSEGSSNFDLHLGDVVERHINHGDWVIFNRQPSLHKMSMMGHQIRVLPYSTFRLNLSVTSPYNADFDGDEMNLHVPQSEEARSEIAQLMHVPTQIVSPQSNKPVMGIVQDSLLGSDKISRRDTFIDLDTVMNLLMWISPAKWQGKLPMPAILKPKPLWTGKQIISLFIPIKIHLERVSFDHPKDEDLEDNAYLSPSDTKVVIRNGTVLMGILCKNTLGKSNGGLIHVIFNSEGFLICRDFINQLQLVINYWLLQNGFSVGIGDTIADESTMETITATIEKAKEEVNSVIDSARKGTLQGQPGRTLEESFEFKVNQVLNNARKTSGTSAQRSLLGTNNLKAMVMSGSKGSYLNIAQIIACVGQQNVEGKRIPFGFKNRTLPHFLKDDFGPESRGFVENSYLRGLTPQEFYFHAMGGREGLIDTAVKTASTGYIQRRLVKAMESLQVKYDMTVRTNFGTVIQWLYGEDGIDGSHIEKQYLHTMRFSLDKMKQSFSWESEIEGYFKQNHLSKRGKQPLGFLDSDVRNKVVTDVEIRKLLLNEWHQLLEDRKTLRESIFPNTSDNDWYLPVNIKRLINRAKMNFNCDNSQPTDLNPSLVIESVRLLLERCQVVRGDDPLTVQLRKDSLLLFSINCRAHLASKVICDKYRINILAWRWLIDQIEQGFRASIVSPGEMVGAIAAQSIGEPATQMTLNTFHFAGVGSKNVTLGVPRLVEIINVVPHIKTPSLTIHLKGEYANDSTLAKTIASRLEHATIKTISRKTQIIFDPDPLNSVIEADREFLSDYYEIEFDELREEGEDDLKLVDKLSPWVLRIELDPDIVTDKNLEMTFIKQKIQEKFPNDLHVVTTDDNASPLVIRIRVSNSEEIGAERRERASALENGLQLIDSRADFLQSIEHILLEKTTLRGLQSIKKVFMHNEKSQVYNSKTEEYEPYAEWVLDTDGSGLADVFSNPHVDASTTTSNDIKEVCDVLGIEAARNAVFAELSKVLSFDGSYVNYRHIALVSDIMTYKGHFTPITRHGVNRVEEAGVLMRSSFEETLDILIEAAANAEVDHVTGVSSAIIMGLTAPVGTGSFDIILDEKALANVEEMAFSTSFAPTVSKSISNLWSKSSDLQGTIQTPMMINSPTHALSPSVFTPLNAHGDISSPSALFSPGIDTGAISPGMAFTPGASFGDVHSPMMTPGAMTPGASFGDVHSPMYSPTGSSMDFSTDAQSPMYSLSPGPSMSLASPMSPIYSATGTPSGGSSTMSPIYSPTQDTPSLMSAASPMSPIYSPNMNTPSLMSAASPMSPLYSPTSTGPSFASPELTSPGADGFATPSSPNIPFSPGSPSIGLTPLEDDDDPEG